MHMLPVFALLAWLCMPAVAEAQTDQTETFTNWFQVDVILFKPLSGSLDDESWPEDSLAYPADVTAVSEPRPFNLSILDQLAEETDISIQETPRLDRDEFVFQRQSRSNFNRRVLQAASGETAEPVPEPESPVPDEEALPETPAVNIDALIAVPQDSAGSLAFSDTTGNSSLTGVLRSLNRSSRYRVLTHESWIQPISSEPTPVIMQAGQRYDDLYEVEGILSLTVSRFLHVQANLWFTEFEQTGILRSGTPPATFANLSQETLSAYPDLLEVEQQRGQYFPARTHVMKQSRRMRSGELHYIDHPLFGVIVQINRYEGPAGPG
jgi:hypothetical protein